MSIKNWRKGSPNSLKSQLMKRRRNSRKLLLLSWLRGFKTTSKLRTANTQIKKWKISWLLPSSRASATNSSLILRPITESLSIWRLQSSSSSSRNKNKVNLWTRRRTISTILIWLILVLKTSTPWPNPLSKKLMTKSIGLTSISLRSTWAKSSRWWPSPFWRPKLSLTISMTKTKSSFNDKKKSSWIFTRIKI